MSNFNFKIGWACMYAAYDNLDYGNSLKDFESSMHSISAWFYEFPETVGEMIAELYEEDTFMIDFSDGEVKLFINTSDTFAWGYAHMSEITDFDTIPEIYEMCKDNKYGIYRWACIKYNTQPQYSIIEDMKKDGFWDDVMESLAENPNNEIYKKKPGFFARLFGTK